MACTIIFSSSSKKVKREGEEQIQVQTSGAPSTTDSSFSSIQSNVPFTQLASIPNSIILSGLPDYKLVSIYKRKLVDSTATVSYGSSNSYYEGEEGEKVKYFMPGFDILYGYNLLNIAHYNIKTSKLSFLFNHPESNEIAINSSGLFSDTLPI